MNMRLTHYFLILITCLCFIRCSAGDTAPEFDPNDNEANNFSSIPKDYFSIEIAPGSNRYVILTDLTSSNIKAYLNTGCLYVSETSTRLKNGTPVDRRGTFNLSNEDGEVFSEANYFGNEEESAEFIISPVDNAIAYMAELSFQENCEGNLHIIANDKIEP